MPFCRHVTEQITQILICIINKLSKQLILEYSSNEICQGHHSLYTVFVSVLDYFAVHYTGTNYSLENIVENIQTYHLHECTCVNFSVCLSLHNTNVTATDLPTPFLLK